MVFRQNGSVEPFYTNSVSYQLKIGLFYLRNKTRTAVFGDLDPLAKNAVWLITLHIYGFSSLGLL